MQKGSLIQFENLKVEYENKLVLNTVSGTLNQNSRIGLVGRNGSGKSTLLKCLAEKVTNYSGRIVNRCTIGYLPQLDLDIYKTDELLYHYLQKQAQEWWTVLAKCEELFGTTLDQNAKLSTLSGGELIKLHFSIMFTQNPDCLILDEPTNHLDLSSLKKLEEILYRLKKPYIIVSHNTSFLNKAVNEIWEINDGKLTVYGGNYDEYKNAKTSEERAKAEDYQATVKKLKKAEGSLHTETIHYQKGMARFSKLIKSGNSGTPKIMLNSWRRKAQTSFGTDKIRKQKSIEKLKEKADSLKERRKRGIYMDLTSKPKTGLILRIENGSVSVADKNKMKLILENINFTIYHKERIAIIGDNGSGKTTFVSQLSYGNAPFLNGTIKYGSAYQTLYVNQKYDLVNPEISILENLLKYKKELSYEQARKILGNLNFPEDYDMKREAGTLSGGETARLAFAIATTSSADLLILDEPTNNLDIETVEEITEALKAYTGALIVITHDLDFIKAIGIEKMLITKISEREIYTIAEKAGH